MAIQYASGSSRINTATTISDKSGLCSMIHTGLVTGCGWTATTTTSSTDHIYQSQVTPQSNQIKVRIWDDGANCVRLRMMNNAETIVQSDSCYLLPAASTTYRIIANQFQFAIFVPGSISSRNFVMASALYLPPHLVAMGLSTCAFILGDGGSDTDSSNTRGSFRTSLNSRGFASATPSQGWTLLNSTHVEYNGLTADSSTHPGLPALMCAQSSAIHYTSGWRWHDDSAFVIEPLIGWGAPTVDSENKIRGQLWDAWIATESYPADITTPFDSRTYYNITDSNDGTSVLPASMRGSLFVAVT
jgi:hypothetical protein